MGSDPKKVYGFEEVAKHDQTNDCWVIIHGKVYDVSPFMEDHAGSEVLLATTRKDASKNFEQVGHSEDARNMMGKYYIGEIDYMSTVPSKRLYTGSPRRPQAQDGINSHYKNPDFVIKALQFLLVPLLILASAFLVRRSLHQGEKSRRLRNISTSCRSNNTSVIAEANISLMQ